MCIRDRGNIVAVRPLRQGVISDYTVTEKMIKHFIQKALGKKSFRKPLVSCLLYTSGTYTSYHFRTEWQVDKTLRGMRYPGYTDEAW